MQKGLLPIERSQVHGTIVHATEQAYIFCLASFLQVLQVLLAGTKQWDLELNMSCKESRDGAHAYFSCAGMYAQSLQVCG